MDAWDAPITVDRLEAFVEPDLCVAHLAPARAAVPAEARESAGVAAGGESIAESVEVAVAERFPLRARPCK